MHWSCLVISHEPGDVEKLLAPYDENLAIEQYRDGGDKTYWRNPQGKWDWWAIGGRYPRRFIPLDPDEPSLVGSVKHTWQWDDKPEDWPGNVRWPTCDQIRKGNIDWESMGRRQLERAKRRWDEVQAKGVQAIDNYLYGINLDTNEVEYLRSAVQFTTYSALTPDGCWHAKETWSEEDGNYIPNDQWGLDLARIIREAGDDDWFSMIDCHS